MMNSMENEAIRLIKKRIDKVRREGEYFKKEYGLDEILLKELNDYCMVLYRDGEVEYCFKNDIFKTKQDAMLGLVERLEKKNENEY